MGRSAVKMKYSEIHLSQRPSSPQSDSLLTGVLAHPEPSGPSQQRKALCQDSTQPC